MKYNFSVKTDLDPKLLGDKKINLNVVISAELRIQIDAQTELPDVLVEAMRMRLATHLEKKLGTVVDPTLISAEN